MSKYTDGSERRKTERRRTKRRLTDESSIEILEHMSDAFAALDREWRYTYVNRAVERNTGLRRDEMLGRTAWEVFPEFAGSQLEGACRRAADEGMTVHFEEYCAPLDRWFEQTVYPAAEGITVYARDITEHRRMDEVLREQERLIHQIAELTPVVINVFDLVTERDTYVSSDVFTLLGYTPEEMARMGDAITPFWHPEDIPIARAQIARSKAAADGEIGEFEYRVRRRDGEWRWLHSRSMPFSRDEHGAVRQIVTATLDVTARKRAEEELGRQNEVLQTIIDNIPVMIRFLGQDARVQLVNRAWEQTLGWSLEEVPLRNLDLFNELYPDPRERQRALDFIAAATGQWTDFSIRTRDGRTIDATLANIRLSDGTNIIIGQDISERKRAEEELRKAHDRLERRVEERTARLSEMNAALQAEVEERQRAEGLWREANQRVEMILDSTTDNFFAVDGQWRYTYFNKHAEEQLKNLGKDPALLIGRVLWDEFPNPASEEQLRRAMTERVVVTHEFYYPPLKEWFENRFYPSPDGGLAIFQTCVTERKRAEEELRRSETTLAEGQRLTHTGSGVWNVATGEVVWSQEMYRIYGFEPGSVTPGYELFMQIVHPDDRPRVEEVFQKVVREEIGYEVEFRVVRPEGRVRLLHSVGHPVYDEAGKLAEVVGTVLDITESRDAEEERRQLLRRLMAAQEEERRRIARQLHDQMGQDVSALGLMLSTLKAKYGAQAELGERLDSLMVIAKQLSEGIDYLVWELRPTALSDFGLVVASSNYVKSWSEHFGVHAELHTTGMEKYRLTDEVETVLYRVLQEALTNVAKHAEASSVSVLLERRSDQVSLIVEDNGVGFDGAQAFGARRKGVGLVGMRERVTLVGGAIEIESVPGAGVTIVVRIPAPHVSGGEERHE